MNRDLSEMFYPWERRTKKSEVATFVRWFCLFSVLLILLLAGMLMDKFYLTDARMGAQTVHAEGKPHQNDYYCFLLKEQGDHILTEKGNDVKSLCAKWGVSL